MTMKMAYGWKGCLAIRGRERERERQHLNIAWIPFIEDGEKDLYTR